MPALVFRITYSVCMTEIRTLSHIITSGKQLFLPQFKKWTSIYLNQFTTKTKKKDPEEHHKGQYYKNLNWYFKKKESIWKETNKKILNDHLNATRF